jgi:hypothetical protein
MARAQGWIATELEQARTVVQLGGLEVSLMTRGERTKGSAGARRSCRAWPVRWRPAVWLRSGVVSRPRALYSRCGALVIVDVAVVNGCFLVPAPRLLIEAPIEMAEGLALSRGSGHGVVGAA